MSIPLPSSIQAAWERAYDAKITADETAAAVTRYEIQHAEVLATLDAARVTAEADAGALESARQSLDLVLDSFLTVGGTAPEEEFPTRAAAGETPPRKKAS